MRLCFFVIFLFLISQVSGNEVYVLSPENVNLGDAFKVNVSFSGNNISGADFILSFDSTILNAGKIYTEQTGFLTSPGNKIDNNNGKIFFAFASVKNKTISGNGNLAVVEFTAKSTGKSIITAEGTKDTPKILRINNMIAEEVSISNAYVSVNGNTTKKADNQTAVNNTAKSNNTAESAENKGAIITRGGIETGSSVNTTTTTGAGIKNETKTENTNNNENKSQENNGTKEQQKQANETKTENTNKTENNNTKTESPEKQNPVINIINENKKEDDFPYYLIVIVILAAALILFLLFKKMKTA